MANRVTPTAVMSTTVIRTGLGVRRHTTITTSTTTRNTIATVGEPRMRKASIPEACTATCAIHSPATAPIHATNSATGCMPGISPTNAAANPAMVTIGTIGIATTFAGTAATPT